MDFSEESTIIINNEEVDINDVFDEFYINEGSIPEDISDEEYFDAKCTRQIDFLEELSLTTQQDRDYYLFLTAVCRDAYTKEFLTIYDIRDFIGYYIDTNLSMDIQLEDKRQNEEYINDLLESCREHDIYEELYFGLAYNAACKYCKIYTEYTQQSISTSALLEESEDTEEFVIDEYLPILTTQSNTVIHLGQYERNELSMLIKSYTPEELLCDNFDSFIDECISATESNTITDLITTIEEFIDQGSEIVVPAELMFVLTEYPQIYSITFCSILYKFISEYNPTK